MKKYIEYMDGMAVSDTLHQRLVELEPPRRTAAWKKYGAAAAGLVLVCGLGGFSLWAAGINGRTSPVPFYPTGYQETAPEAGEVVEPDIAPAEPGDVIEPGMKTIGGYEVRGEDQGPETPVAYCVLPYIEYGPPPATTADYSLAPPDGGLRGATREDALALVGGEDALTAHLNWGECEFSGTVGFESDGTVWMMSLWGESADAAFSLELSPNRLPPTCCVIVGEQRTITEVWGVEVSGVKNMGAYGDTERGVYLDVTREVEFIANGVGCRLKVYGTQDGAVEELVSRFVRWAVLEGLDLSGISPEGAKPLEIDPNDSVGEPNWNDGGEGTVCPYCEDGTAHTHPYDPNGAADPACHAPDEEYIDG